MKRNLFLVLALLVILLAIVQWCKYSSKDPSTVTTKATSNDSNKCPTCPSIEISYPPFIRDQLIVIYKEQPTSDIRKKVRERIFSALSKYKNPINKKLINKNREYVFRSLESDNPEGCNGCDGRIELLNWPGIDEFIHATARISGTGGGGIRGHGEDDLAYYILNYVNLPSLDRNSEHINDNRNPFPALVNKLTPAPFFALPAPGIDTTGKQKVIIAVLDSGIAPDSIDPSYLWENPNEQEGTSDGDGNCYPGDVHGWNFVNGSVNLYDDHVNKHGTLISKYIIDQFTGNAPNYVKIMTLKTLDSTGFGKLFDIFCAIQYAKNEGANIINASFGFYYYEEDLHELLNKIITEPLQAAGILFFTAAGNQIAEEDRIAMAEGIPESALRDLAQHHFYPAYLSNESNIIFAITTTVKDGVSPSQNHSSLHVDLGVEADVPKPFVFLDPFSSTTLTRSGSSYATAIAAGQVGAFFPPGNYSSQNKQQILQALKNLPTNGRYQSMRPIEENPSLINAIRQGHKLMHRPNME
jgi:hypothetical protein